MRYYRRTRSTPSRSNFTEPPAFFASSALAKAYKGKYVIVMDVTFILAQHYHVLESLPASKRSHDQSFNY